MGKKKKEIKIIKKDSKKGDYTFVSNNILKNTKNESTNNEIKSRTKPNDRIEKKIKKEIKIIKKDSKKGDYTFVRNNILKNTKNESKNNEIKSRTKPNDRIEKKIHSKKGDNKGRKILGKSM